MSEKFFCEFDYPEYNDWKNEAINALKGAPFDKKMFIDTYEGITLEPIYKHNVYDKLNSQLNNLPGFMPYLRANDYLGILAKGTWSIAQKIPYPLPQQFNNAIKNDLRNGQNAVFLNYNTNNIINHNKTNIRNINDFKTAIDGIEFEKTPLLLNDENCPESAYFLIKSLINDGIYDKAKLSGIIFNDPIANFARTGKSLGAIASKVRNIAEAIRMMNDNNLRLFTADASVYHNGGSNAVQELAFSLSSAVYYIRELLKENIDINSIADKIAFVLPIGKNFFMEIAKIRAARILWAKIIDSFSGNAKSQKMYIHSETSLRETTKYDPWVNLLRATSETFSAIAGGVDSLTVTNFDAVWGLPNDFSRRTARNTQNVLKYESHLIDTIDPAGGSWYIESLTQQFAEMVWAKFQSIEKHEGMLAAIENSIIQNEVIQSYKERLNNLSIRKEVILGTNKYPNLQEKIIDNVFTVNEIELDKYSNSLKFDAQLLDKFNTSDISFTDISDYITKGLDLSIIPAKLYDNSFTTTQIPLRRSSEIFEKLRENSDNYLMAYGNRPKVHLVCWGALKEYKPRADFASDFFQVGGFETHQVGGFKDFDDMAQSLIDFKESVFVFCSTDDRYEEFLGRISKLLKKVKPFSKLILAGYPKDKIEEYKEAGIDEFIHIKANIYNILSELQKDLGMNSKGDK